MTRLRKIHTRRHVRKHKRAELHRVVDASLAQSSRRRRARV